MKISKINQNVNGVISSYDPIDVVICCCGYEERSTSLLQYHGDTMVKVQHRYALSFSLPNDKRLQSNRKKFRDFGFTLIEITGTESLNDRYKIYDSILEAIEPKDNLNILVDYSSMNREWYGGLLLYFEKLNADNFNNIVCYFYYCIPEYKGNVDSKYSISAIKPLAGFCNISIPSMPMSLAIGLGSEEKVLYGLHQFADVDSSYAHYYYTNNQHIFDEKDKYRQLLNSIDASQKHEYELSNLVPVFNSLCDIYQMIKRESRMTIISCGPKPFTLLSLVFARIYSIDVWKVYSNISDHYVEKIPSKERVVLKFEYQSDSR